jgi:hypothetical protein
MELASAAFVLIVAAKFSTPPAPTTAGDAEALETDTIRGAAVAVAVAVVDCRVGVVVAVAVTDGALEVAVGTAVEVLVGTGPPRGYAPPA